jgi:hypothetical protein
MTGRTSGTGWTRAAIVAAMAYAFVLQILLLSASGAFHAAQAAQPQGIICVQNGSSAPDHAPSKAHDGLCCTLSCHGSAPVGPVPAAGVFERLASTTVVATAPDRTWILRLSSNVLPVGSRAPPRLG